MRYQMSLEAQFLNQGYTNEWMIDYVGWVIEQIDRWGDTSKYINTRAFSNNVWEKKFISSALVDATLLITAIFMIYFYSFFVLGSCSPIHMRIVSAFFGLCCIGISAAAGYGIASFFGWKMTPAHGVLPFLLLGLGVDDMFVIVNSID